MTSYIPTVHCSVEAGVSRLKSCTDIISFMPASREHESFGPRERQGDLVKLPDSFYSGEIGFLGAAYSASC